MTPTSRFYRWMFRRRLRREIEDELRLHLQMRAEEYERTGLPAGASRRKAVHRFGSVQRVTAACYAVYRLPNPATQRRTFMESVWQDLRYAIRSLARQPGFTCIVLLTLATGIGANTVIFSAVNSTLLHPIPFEGGDRWVSLWHASPEGSMRFAPTPEVIHAWRERAATLESLAAYSTESFVVDLNGEPERLTGAAASVELLPFLGVQPIQGRGFVADDTIPGNNHVVLLTERVWHQWFDAAEDAVGATMTLNREPYTIIGVLPERVDAFAGGGSIKAGSIPDYAVWVPAANARATVARLRPGVDLEAAQAEITAIHAQLGLDPDDPDGWAPVVMRPQENVARDLRVGLWVLLGAVGFVLLVACVNVANMMLARGVARGHELAVRTAIGAGRGRVVRQLVVESLALTGAAALLGLAAAHGAIVGLRARLPAGLSELSDARIDATVLAAIVCIATVTGVLFGLVPAAQVRGLNVATLLGASRHAGPTTRSRSALRSWLVGSQIALATTLLVGAGLMVRSLLELNRHDPGFQPANLVSLRLDFPPESYPNLTARTAFLENLLDRMEQLPMVEHAAIGAIGTRGLTEGAIEVEGNPETLPGRPFMMNVVSPGYFAAVGMTLAEGREFADAEMTEDAQETIVNENFARVHWPGGSAVGKRFRFEGRDEWQTVIGVARNVAFSGLRANPDLMTMYQPYPTWDIPSTMIAVRAVGDPGDVAPLLKGQVWSLDRELVPVITLATQLIADAVARPRFNALLLTAFAVLAVALAAVGVYGVVALSMQQRTHELGVRVALGADGSQLLSLVVAQGMRPVAAGAVAGLALAVGLTRFLRSLLFEVQPTDPLTFVVVTAVLAAAGFAACYWPARAATRLDPVEVLRAE